MSAACQIPVERSEIATRDQDEANEFIRQIYVGHQPRVGHGPGDTEFRVRTARVGALGVDRLRITAPLDTDTEEFGLLVCYSLLHGAARISDRAEEARLGSGDPVLYPSGTPLRVQLDDIDIPILRLSPERVAVLVEAHTGLDAADLRFESLQPVSTAMGRHFNNVLGLVYREVMNEESALALPLVTEQLTQTAAAAVLATFPNTTKPAEHLPGPGRIAPAALRRAVAYIDAHAGEPIDLGAIATAAGVAAARCSRPSASIPRPPRWAICGRYACTGPTANWPPPTPPAARPWRPSPPGGALPDPAAFATAYQPDLRPVAQPHPAHLSLHGSIHDQPDLRTRRAEQVRHNRHVRGQGVLGPDLRLADHRAPVQPHRQPAGGIPIRDRPDHHGARHRAR